MRAFVVVNKTNYVPGIAAVVCTTHICSRSSFISNKKETRIRMHQDCPNHMSVVPVPLYSVVTTDHKRVYDTTGT